MDEGRTVVGRGEHCDLCLDDERQVARALVAPHNQPGIAERVLELGLDRS